MKTKYICIEDFKLRDRMSGSGSKFEKGKIYFIRNYNPNKIVRYYDIFDSNNLFITDVSLGILLEKFMTLSEYREKRINEILND